MSVGNKWYKSDTVNSIINKTGMYKKTRIDFNIMNLIYEQFISKSNLNEKNGVNYNFYLKTKIILHGFI